MPKYTIDFRANKIKGKTPCSVSFFPYITSDTIEWQDSDTGTNSYQDTDTGLPYQDSD